MQLNTSGQTPIYLQIAEQLEESIFTGALEEESQIPSTNEISIQYKINPATVLKGMNLLVDDNIIYKKRGIGMFVKHGAYDAIKSKRQETFYTNYIQSMVDEAKKLSISQSDIIEMIARGYETNEH